MKTMFNLKMISKAPIMLGVFVFAALMISSCGSSTNEKNETGNDTTSVRTPEDDSLGIDPKVKVTSEDMKSTDKTSGRTITELIEKSEKDGNAVFLVVTDSSRTELTKALKIAKSANLSVRNSVVITMDREDKENKKLVSDYGIAGAPLPLILIISPKGNLADGFVLEDASVDLLVKSIPSPKQDDVLNALDDSKSAFIIVAKKSFTDKATALETCKEAAKLNAGKSEIIEVDLTDTKESDFLELLRVNKTTKSTAIVVVNSKGQITGSFYEPKDAASLAALANKVQSGCGSGCAVPCN